MKTFYKNDYVIGVVYRFDESLDDYEPHLYSGTVEHDFEDGSYLVINETDNKEVLVELYADDTMRIGTKLDKVL